MKKNMLKPDVISYNTLIRSYALCEHHTSTEYPLDFYYEMKSLGIKPDLYTCLGLIRSQRGSDAHIKWVLNEIRALGIAPEKDELVWTNLSDILLDPKRDEVFSALVGRSPRAQQNRVIEVVQVAERFMPGMGAIFYTKMIQECSKLRDLRNGLAIYERIRQQRPGHLSALRTLTNVCDLLARTGQMTTSNLNNLLHQFRADAGEFSSASEILPVYPDSETVRTMMRGFQTRGDWPGLLRTFRQFPVARTDVRCWNFLLGAALKLNAPEAIPTLLEELEAEPNVVKNVVTYSRLIAWKGSGGDVNAALDVLDELAAKQLRPNARCLKAVIDVYNEKNDPTLFLEAWDLFKSVSRKYEIFEPTARTSLSDCVSLLTSVARLARLGKTSVPIFEALKFVEVTAARLQTEDKLAVLPGLYESAYHSALEIGDKGAAKKIEDLMKAHDILRKKGGKCTFFANGQQIETMARDPRWHGQDAIEMFEWLQREHGYRENLSGLRDQKRGSQSLAFHAEKQALAYWWKNCYEKERLNGNQKSEPIFFVNLIVCKDCKDFFRVAAKALETRLVVVDPQGTWVAEPQRATAGEEFNA